MKRNRWHTLLVVAARLSILVYLGMVLYVCFGHFSQLPDMSKTFLGIPRDKIIHFTMFFPFPIIAALAIDRLPRTPWKALLQSLLILAAGLAIAAATEIGQGMTNYRDRSLLDWVADSTALGISTLLVFLILLLKVRRSALCPPPSEPVS